MPRERSGDARELEDAADLVVEVHGARQRVRLGPALDHLHAPAALAEQDGEGLADRPVADDRDVDPFARYHGSVAPRPCSSFSSMSEA